MASSKKREEVRIERALRALLKLPENRRCINCNSLGPQYICTTFLTFVCTNCSGIHREFTHRVKSVSIATFTAQEVAALEAAGNGRARQIYFKEFDPKRHSYPDSSNLQRLREFIRQVYLDRRYYGENQKLQRKTLSDEEQYQPRKTNSYNGRTRSPLHDDDFDPRYREKPSPGGRGEDRSFIKNIFEEKRSLSLSQDNLRRGGKKSTTYFEIVDNRVRGGRRRDGLRSPDSSSRVHRSCSPVVIRPTRDDDRSTQKNQNTTISADEKSKERKGASMVNLIDFDMDPEPEIASEPSQQMTQNNVAPSTNEKATQIPNVNSLEDLLFGLSVFPTDPPGDVTGGSKGSSSEACEQSQPVSLPLNNSEQNQPSVSQQPQTSTFPPNAQSPSSGFTKQQFKDSSKPTQEAISGSLGASQSLPSGFNPTGRTELPMDLFANFPEPAPNWQVGPSQGIGYNSHYYPNPRPQAFPTSSRSKNPFDDSDETPKSSAPQFPSMDPTSLSYGSPMASHPNAFASPRPQESDSIARKGDPFASLMVNPGSNISYPAPNTTGSIPSKGGNPFG